MEFETTSRLFEWDDDKALKNKGKHGVSFEKAIRVFDDNFRVERYDEYHSDYEDRWITIGRVDDILFVVYTERADRTRIISARLADKSERREYYGNRQNAY